VKLYLAPGLTFDLDSPEVRASGLRAYVLGESGSGKSAACASIAGQLLEGGKQVFFLDMHGENAGLWGLAPAKVTRFGYGESLGDIDTTSKETIAESAAAAIAPMMEAVRIGQSVLVNLREWAVLEPAKLDAWSLAFIRALYAFKVKMPGFSLLVVEECHQLAPQAQSKGQSDNVRVLVSITTDGRKYGLNCLYATQRQSLVDVSVLACCNIRIFLRLTDLRDWDKIRSAVPKELGMTFEKISHFQNGEAVITCPWKRAARVKLFLPEAIPRV
jgi:DNA helicase HerA-like ATPase